MTIKDIHELLKKPEYDFLRKDKRLGDNIILLGLGGSLAYGTNLDSSDIDLRGCAINSTEEIILGEDFEQVVDRETDTVTYSIKKLFKLLTNCNPNTFEILGLRDDQIIYVNDIGRKLLENRHIFLSKRAYFSFSEYAKAQLRSLENKSARNYDQSRLEMHILNSIQSAKETFPRKYFSYKEDNIRLYIDQAVNDELDKEIFMDVNLSGYPLRGYLGMWSELKNIIKEYTKLGKRNAHAIAHNKLGKHMLYLVRLYYMGIEVLSEGKIQTYRDGEHDLLMKIRDGEFLDDNSQPVEEFYDMLDELDKKLVEAYRNSELPEEPRYGEIKELLYSILYDKVVK